MDKHSLKIMVRGIYDIQKVRIEMGNRVVAAFKAKLGIEPGQKEELSEFEAKKLLKELRQDFKLLTDGVVKISKIKNFGKAKIISEYTELLLMRQYEQLIESEEQQFRDIGIVLKKFPVWTQFLKNVKGVGPAMAGVIISEIDIEKARYPSSLWKYAGLDVADNGAGRSRKKEHLVEIQYTDKNGKPASRVGITFNPFLKTKLVGVLGSSFLKSKSYYADIYYDYRNRLENHPKHKEKTKGHKHNMATRYMIKQFLVDLYSAWRALEGLPVAAPYHETKLGLRHRAVG